MTKSPRLCQIKCVINYATAMTLPQFLPNYVLSFLFLYSSNCVVGSGVETLISEC